MVQSMQVGVRTNTSGQTQIAPITGNNKGLQRAEIKQGIREIVTCKDANGKLGLRCRHVNNVSVVLITLYKSLAFRGWCNLILVICMLLSLNSFWPTYINWQIDYNVINGIDCSGKSCLCNFNLSNSLKGNFFFFWMIATVLKRNSIFNIYIANT